MHKCINLSPLTWLLRLHCGVLSPPPPPPRPQCSSSSRSPQSLFPPCPATWSGEGKDVSTSRSKVASKKRKPTLVMIIYCVSRWRMSWHRWYKNKPLQQVCPYRTCRWPSPQSPPKPSRHLKRHPRHYHPQTLMSIYTKKWVVKRYYSHLDLHVLPVCYYRLIWSDLKTLKWIKTMTPCINKISYDSIYISWLNLQYFTIYV